MLTPMPIPVKNLFRILVKKVKTKIGKKYKKKDVELEYLQICHDLRSRGMVSIRVWEIDIISEDCCVDTEIDKDEYCEC